MFLAKLLSENRACIWVSAPIPAFSPAPENATVMPEYAEECGGQEERGAHGPGCWPTGYGKLLRPPGAQQAGAGGQTGSEPGSAQSLSQAPPTPFSAEWGPAEMGPLAGRGAQPLLPPPEGSPGLCPSLGVGIPGGKEKGVGFFFFFSL